MRLRVSKSSNQMYRPRKIIGISLRNPSRDSIVVSSIVKLSRRSRIENGKLAINTADVEPVSCLLIDTSTTSLSMHHHVMHMHFSLAIA